MPLQAYLPAKIHKKLKIYAIENDYAMTDIMTYLVTEFLKNPRELPIKKKGKSNKSE